MVLQHKKNTLRKKIKNYLPITHYKLLKKFINILTKNGKKSKATKLVFLILSYLKKAYKINPVLLVYISISILKPTVHLKNSSKKSKFKLILELPMNKQIFMAFKWIKMAFTKSSLGKIRGTNTNSKKIAQELINIYNKKGVLIENKYEIMKFSKMYMSTLHVRSYYPPSLVTLRQNKYSNSNISSLEGPISKLYIYRKKQRFHNKHIISFWIPLKGLKARKRLVNIWRLFHENEERQLAYFIKRPFTQKKKWNSEGQLISKNYLLSQSLKSKNYLNISKKINLLNILNDNTQVKKNKHLATFYKKHENVVSALSRSKNNYLNLQSFFYKKQNISKLLIYKLIILSFNYKRHLFFKQVNKKLKIKNKNSFDSKLLINHLHMKCFRPE